MSGERERPALYEADKDNPDLWGEAVEAPHERPRTAMPVTITINFTAEEAERIRRGAQAYGLTYSEVVRKAVRDLAHAQSAVNA